MALARGAMFAAITVALLLSVTATEAGLQVGYYSQSCPQAEQIVKEELDKALQQDSGIGADLLRLHFHDCFVRGCDGSVLIDSTKGNTAEKDGGPNPTIEDEAFDVVDNAKARIEAVCKATVSCADILAFLARDSIAHYGGVFFPVPAGRRDGTISRASETSDLPPPVFNLTLLLPMFTKKGLDLDDMVTLSGAHTIGVAHCPAFANRLYNFSQTTSTDPTLDPTYAAQLKQKCPPADNTTEVDMDPPSPLTFDNSYWKGLLANRGLFTSDHTLLTTRKTLKKVKRYAKNGDVFKAKFAAAVVKMSKIGVRTGKEGEIRTNCRVVN